VSVPVDRRFVPTVAQLRDLWVKHLGSWASVPEKIELELGFDQAMLEIRQAGPIPEGLCGVGGCVYKLEHMPTEKHSWDTP
jgi:hypothetical protein